MAFYVSFDSQPDLTGACRGSRPNTQPDSSRGSRPNTQPDSSGGSRPNTLPDSSGDAGSSYSSCGGGQRSGQRRGRRRGRRKTQQCRNNDSDDDAESRSSDGSSQVGSQDPAPNTETLPAVDPQEWIQLFKLVLSQFNGRTKLGTLMPKRGNLLQGFSYSQVADGLRCSEHFLVFEKDGKIKWVSVHSRKIRLCFNYKVYGTTKCHKDKCPFFHICRDFITGTCPGQSSCGLCHSFRIGSNAAVCDKAALQDFTDEEIHTIVLRSAPVVCDKFNKAGCFDDCPELHVCAQYIRKRCSDENCEFGHTLKGTDHNDWVLETFHMQKVIENTLQKLLLTHRNDRNGDESHPGNSSVDKAMTGGSPSQQKPAMYSGATEQKPATYSGAKLTEHKPATYSGAKLTEHKPATYSGAKLTEQKPATYSGAKFTEQKPATYSGAKLTEQKPAMYSGAKFTEQKPVTYSGANLTDQKPATYSGANLTDQKPATYSGANLTEQKPATYSGAKFTEQKPATYSGANLTDQKPTMYIGAKFTEQKPATYSGANLTDQKPASYSGANLTEQKPATYSGAKFTDQKPATYSGANLTDQKPATYSGANLTDQKPATYSGANLTEQKPATYSGAKFTEQKPATYSGANLTDQKPATYSGANLTEQKPATYSGAKFTEQKPATYSGANLTDQKPTMYIGAKFTEQKPATYSGANLTDQKPATYSGANLTDQKPATYSGANLADQKPATNFRESLKTQKPDHMVPAVKSHQVTSIDTSEMQRRLSQAKFRQSLRKDFYPRNSIGAVDETDVETVRPVPSSGGSLRQQKPATCAGGTLTEEKPATSVKGMMKFHQLDPCVVELGKAAASARKPVTDQKFATAAGGLLKKKHTECSKVHETGSQWQETVSASDTELCEHYSWTGRCPRAPTCPRYHHPHRRPFVWQLHVFGAWHDLSVADSMDIEERFCALAAQGKFEVFLPSIGGLQISLNFNTMSAIVNDGSDYNPQRVTDVRRWSVPSYVDGDPDTALSLYCQWVWHYQIPGGHFATFNSGCLQYTLEEKYLRGQHNYYFEDNSDRYRALLSQMKFRDLVKGGTSPLLRRPFQPLVDYGASVPLMCSALLSKQPKVHQSELPAHWCSVDHFQHFELVLLERNSAERRVVQASFHATLHPDIASIVHIFRVQNPTLWDKFCTTKRSMAPRDGSVEEVEERALFHGTPSLLAARGICTNSTDFRLAGDNVGARYGRGSYFSTTASYSHNYTHGPNRFMFQAKVLVGKYARGHSSYKTPPLREGLKHYDSCVNDKANPTIFVIFELAQSYPEYLIQYTDAGGVSAVHSQPTSGHSAMKTASSSVAQSTRPQSSTTTRATNAAAYTATPSTHPSGLAASYTATPSTYPRGTAAARAATASSNHSVLAARTLASATVGPSAASYPASPGTYRYSAAPQRRPTSSSSGYGGHSASSSGAVSFGHGADSSDQASPSEEKSKPSRCVIS